MLQGQEMIMFNIDVVTERLKGIDGDTLFPP